MTSRGRSIALCAFATVGLAASSASADWTFGNFNGDYLYRSGFTLGNNELIVVQTTNCSGNADTVLFLLEGNVYTDGPKTTRAFNDDWDGTFCSFIYFQNTSGSAKDYTVVGTTFSPNSPADVSLTIYTTQGGSVTNPLHIGGAPHRFGGNGSREQVQVVPVRPAFGGKPMDSVLFVIDPTIGGPARFDDDSGLQLLSKTSNLDCTNKTCWAVAGNYWLDNGGNIMVWSQGSSPDSDGDGVTNQIETNLGTLPTRADFDGDGLSDFVEFVGVQAPGGLAGADSSLCMPWQDADALTQDVFIQADYMQDTNPVSAHSHQPYAQLGNDVQGIFTDAQQMTARNIRVHFEVGQNVGHWPGIEFSTCAATGNVNFYTIKNNGAFFDPLRRLVYHYVVFGHQIYNAATCQLLNNSGVAEFWGNDVIVTLNSGASSSQQRGTQMHELGHNFYLDHNGNDDSVVGGGYGCVHSSVMNYRWQTNGFGNALNSTRAFGYSRGLCLSGSSNAAQAGTDNCSTTPTTCSGSCVPAGQVTLKATCPLGSATGPYAGKRVSNGTCDCDRDEWSQALTPTANRLALAFQASGEAMDGAGGGPTDQEITEYVHGAPRLLGPRQVRLIGHKRATMESQGLREGREFRYNPENGKFYSRE